jgi:hypothetical protein
MIKMSSSKRMYFPFFNWILAVAITLGSPPLPATVVSRWILDSLIGYFENNATPKNGLPEFI